MSTSSLMCNKSMVMISPKRASNTRQREAKGHHVCKCCLHYPVQKGGTNLSRYITKQTKVTTWHQFRQCPIALLVQSENEKHLSMSMHLHKPNYIDYPTFQLQCVHLRFFLLNDIIVVYVLNGNKTNICSMSPPHQTFQIFTSRTF